MDSIVFQNLINGHVADIPIARMPRRPVCGTLAAANEGGHETETRMSFAGVRIAALVEAEFEDLELLPAGAR